LIEAGLLRAGRYERYLEAFRRLLIVLQGRARIGRIFEQKTPEERRRFYEEEWDRRAWRIFFRVFFSRAVLGRAGLDPEFFTYVEGIGGFGEHFRARARHVLCDLPAQENYFLAQICLGRYLDLKQVPPYLREENFEHLRQAVERIEIVTGEIGPVLASAADSSIDAFALSNIFEWFSAEAFERTLREIHRASAPGARLCYRNLLVRRRHPASIDPLFEHDDEFAARLLEQDRSFVYSHFEIAAARKEPAGERSRHAYQVAVENAHPSLDPGRPGLRHAGRPAVARR
jgi:S-adenosylmethionine-diacylglycerol 3-amino-3-carboxypropyl transferase